MWQELLRRHHHRCLVSSLNQFSLVYISVSHMDVCARIAQKKATAAARIPLNTIRIHKRRRMKKESQFHAPSFIFVSYFINQTLNTYIVCHTLSEKPICEQGTDARKQTNWKRRKEEQQQQRRQRRRRAWNNTHVVKAQFTHTLKRSNKNQLICQFAQDLRRKN